MIFSPCTCGPIGQCDDTEWGRFAHAWLHIAWVWFQREEREAEVRAAARDLEEA